MKFIKTFEVFDYDSYVKKYGKEVADQMSKTSWGQNQIKSTKKEITLDNITDDDIKNIVSNAGYINLDSEHIDEEDAMEHVRDTLARLRQQPNTMTLYRIVAVDKVEDINKDKVGKHYVLDKWMVCGDLVLSAGVNPEGEKEVYVLTVEVDKKWIDLKYTILTNYSYMTEKEVSLKDNAKVKILNIEHFEDFDNSL